ncbi:MAG TPA: hypothetical protein VFA20_00925 [Myxococcaceae bacterium]|nr:hypothetical protein [Myxococcaceae bacterium]
MDPYQLGQSLIVDPEVPFSELDQDLRATGFERDPEVGGASGVPSLVPGEPELAGWTYRGHKPFLTYTFNPAVQLRVLDAGYAPPAVRAAIAARVKLLEPPQVRTGLESPDVRARLRCLFAAGETDRLDLRDRVEKMKGDPEPLVAKAAGDLAHKLDKLVDARVKVLTTLRLLAEAARGFLHRLNERSYVATLAPRRADIAKLFDEDIASDVADLVMAEWARPPLANVGDGMKELAITAATAGLLRFPSELSDPFPRGYRDIAPWMVPSRVWLTWSWSRTPGTPGVRYEGLVWLDDRWALLPRPFHAVSRVLQTKLGAMPGTTH